MSEQLHAVCCRKFLTLLHNIGNAERYQSLVAKLTVGRVVCDELTFTTFGIILCKLRNGCIVSQIAIVSHASVCRSDKV